MVVVVDVNGLAKTPNRIEAQVANGILCTGGKDIGSVFGSVPTASVSVLAGMGGKAYVAFTATGRISQVDSGRGLGVYRHCQSDGAVATSCIVSMNGEGAGSVNCKQVVVIIGYFIAAEVNMVRTSCALLDGQVYIHGAVAVLRASE